jgi:hypothetical protein
MSGITGDTLDIMNDVTVGGSLYVTSGITGDTLFITNGVTGGTFFGNGTGLTNLPVDVIGTTLYANSVTVNTSGFSQTNGVFIGNQSGMDASGANSGVFIGDSAGLNATGNTQKSNFIGYYAGHGAHNVYNANYIGVNAGENAVGADKSNFIGHRVGENASGSTYSTFIGRYAGSGAHGSSNSIFLGNTTGQDAHTTQYSNYIGDEAGYQADNVSYSNFIGKGAGRYAANADFANFIGWRAGEQSTGATKSNIFGYLAGSRFLGNDIGANNIIIGTNVTLPNATNNGLNIGGVLFGTGLHSDVSLNPSITGTAGAKIGINVVNPTVELHVSGDTIVTGNITGETITLIQNGSAENILVGDDAYIGDINVSNTIQVKGQQDDTVGYVKLGISGATIGGASRPDTITPSTIRTVFNISNIEQFADNAAALTGGLISGDLYRTGDLLKIVH